jgi:hypothetical protein
MKMSFKVSAIAFVFIVMVLFFQVSNNFETNNATGQCADYPLGLYNCNSNSLPLNPSETISAGGGKIRWVALVRVIGKL